MFDRLVADGDRTTTGGEVIGRSDYFNEDGRMYARKENHATCGNCRGGWPIYGTAGNWMDDGDPLVKDHDRVLCPCGRNFVLAAASSNAFYSDSRDKTSASPRTTTTAYHWIAFRLNDAGNCVGWQCIAHFTDGSSESATVDASNTVRFERAENGNACARVELFPDDCARASASVSASLLAAIAG